ncbi:S-adenosylmethionine:tRNA ribosyltransferase-isomerase, partial [Listeria monocytogenes]
PLKNRDQSRLLVLNRKNGNMEHLHFKDVINYFNPGDTLVLNDTRVMPARLFGLKEETGAKVEMLMLTQIEGNDWEVLLKPAKRIKVGNQLNFGDGKIIAECIEELD